MSATVSAVAASTTCVTERESAAALSPGCDTKSCPSAENCHHHGWGGGQVSALQLGNFWTKVCSASLFESPFVSYSR